MGTRQIGKDSTQKQKNSPSPLGGKGLTTFRKLAVGKFFDSGRMGASKERGNPKG